jgi:acyl-CoA synthetase (AMP-forming)/AMP-acid ligase II
MRYCVLGGEPLKQQLSDDIQKQLGIFPLAGYGLAETSAALVSNLPEDVKWILTLPHRLAHPPLEWSIGLSSKTRPAASLTCFTLLSFFGSLPIRKDA